MTRVFAVNGSASMEKGATASLLSPFVEGMKEAGASVDLVYAKRLNAKPCLGEFHCWYKKPGECVIEDVMEKVYPKLRESEVLLLATPVYIPLPGEIQNFINRLCPLMEPILGTKKGHTRARLHSDVKLKKVLLVSTGGWWERGNLLTVVRIAKELADKAGMDFSGAILRPHAFLLWEDEYRREKEEILGAARKAGSQFIKDGEISKGLLNTISQPLVTQETLRKRYNQMYADIAYG